MAQGFTAEKLVRTKTGEEYVDGEQIFTLTYNLPGAPLAKEDRFGEHRRDYGYKMGQSIAKLHAALQEVEPDIMPDEPNFYQSVTEWALPNVQKQNQQWNMGLPESFFSDYVDSFGKIVSKLPAQLIHRDLHPSNVLFNKGDVSGFIRFDVSERGSRLRDPCYCATGLLVEWEGVDNIQEKWPLVLEGILHGYDSINPLTPEEKQTVYYVLCSIEMVCIAYFDSVEEFQELAKRNREMLQYIVRNRALIQNIF